MPITAARFDRLAEEGKDGRYAKYFEPISHAEMEKMVKLSRQGKLDAYMRGRAASDR